MRLRGSLSARGISIPRVFQAPSCRINISQCGLRGFLTPLQRQEMHLSACAGYVLEAKFSSYCGLENAGLRESVSGRIRLEFVRQRDSDIGTHDLRTGPSTASRADTSILGTQRELADECLLEQLPFWNAMRVRIGLNSVSNLDGHADPILA